MEFGENGGTTVRVTFKQDDGTELKMLFGTSYKHWSEQLTEFVYRNFGSKTEGWRYKDVRGRILKVERSRSAWKGWGGLKWCSEDVMQEELNREGVQRNEPDNPRPRQYKDFVFRDWPYGKRKALKELRAY